MSSPDPIRRGPWLIPLLALSFVVTFLAAAMPSASGAAALGLLLPPSVASQARPLHPGLPPRAPLFPRKEPMSSSGQSTTGRYSQSAWAANMVMPAIWLGLPTIVILALIIRSMKGD